MILEKASEAKGISQVEGGDPKDLLDPSEVTSGLQCSVLVYTVQESQGATEEETTKMIRNLDHLSHEERVQELPLFLSLEKTERGSHQYIQVSHRQVPVSFQWLPATGQGAMSIK